MSSVYPSYGNTSTRRCQRCGGPLAPNEVNCRACGQYNALAPAGGPPAGTLSPSNTSSGEISSPTNTGGKQFAGPPWGKPPTLPAQPGSFGGGFVPQHPGYSGASYNIPQTQQPGYAVGPYSGPQPPLYSQVPPPTIGFQQNGMNGYRPVGFTSPPPQKRGLNIGLVLGIVILLLVVVGGGVVAMLYITGRHNSNIGQGTSVTPGVSAIPTPAGPSLFADSFQDNKNSWDLTSIAGKFSVKVGGGSMVLEDDDNRLLYELLPGSKTYDNFQLNLDAALTKGDPNNGYGVYIRGASNQNSDLATYYRFELYGDGTYAIFKGLVDANGTTHDSKLVDYTSNAAIAKAGSVNHFTIVAHGPSMKFIVNGQVLTTVSDNSYTNGTIALFVSNLPNLPPVAQATFSNLAIYRG